jgi:hypothetical protein
MYFFLLLIKKKAHDGVFVNVRLFLNSVWMPTIAKR